MSKKNLSQLRLEFKPQLPVSLDDVEQLVGYPEENTESSAKIQTLFPKTHSRPVVHFKSGFPMKHALLKVGVVFSGGQASGGHNVITGLFDALKKMNPATVLLGFKNGPQGIVEGKYVELTEGVLQNYRNQGGFDLIGSGRTKIETPEQFESVDRVVRQLDLDGLVIIGGDDSNTNAGILAEFFAGRGRKIRVVGVPKTIDGDLHNKYIEAPFGFDTAAKTFSNTIGDIARDALSAKKYYFFIKLMGRSASHITLECALQTHANVALIGEEVAAEGKTLQQISEEVASIIITRSAQGKDYGVVLVPEGLIEFIPEFNAMIKELNRLLAENNVGAVERMSESSQKLFKSLPNEIQQQLLLDRDPHGNVQVSKIETERLLIEMVKQVLKGNESYKGKFNAQPLFLGYEGRCPLPSNFDAQYCYALGHVAALLVNGGYSGYMATVRNLHLSAAEWEIAGIPLTTMFTFEVRKGKETPVIEKHLVDLAGPVFKEFKEKRKKWAVEDDYIYPGPIQYFGPAELVNSVTLSMELEAMVVKA